MFAHTMIAGVTHQDVWNLSAEEAEKISNACANYIRHYDIGATQKSIDLAALVGTLGMTYAPRVAVTVFGKKQAENKQPAPQPVNFSVTGGNGFTK